MSVYNTKNDDFSLFKKIVIYSIFVVLVVSLFGFGITRCQEMTHTKDAVIVYEEFLTIYETCDRINNDLCTLQAIPDDDKMFEQITKEQRKLALKSNLNRWINEYNAKSKMFGRNLWKSNELPYQLYLESYNCYNN
jgi:hypothetical protein